MGSILQDLRHAVRVLLKSRGFTAAAIVALALGIGANSAIFSVVNLVLLRPLPFPESDQLVQVFQAPPAQSLPGTRRFAVSPGNYLDWRALGKSFEGMAAYGPRQFAMTVSNKSPNETNRSIEAIKIGEPLEAAWIGPIHFSASRPHVLVPPRWRTRELVYSAVSASENPVPAIAESHCR